MVRFRAFWGLRVLVASVLVGLRMVNFSAVAVLSFIFDLITCVCDCRESSSVGAGPVVVVAVAMSSGSLTLELSATRRAALMTGLSTDRPRPRFTRDKI